MSFYLSKILWLIINPLNIILLLIIIGFILKFKKKNYKFFYLLALILFFFTSILPIGNFLIYQLEKKFHEKVILPEKIDGILILAGATNLELSQEYDNINLNGSVERLIESIYLIKNYPDAKIVFSGGSGLINKQNISHSDLAKKFFHKFKIDTEKIIFESKSRNTYESILYSKEIINPDINQNWLLITSAFHMRRSINIGKKLNWKFIPYAVDFNETKKIKFIPSLNILNNMNKFQSASHEWVGLIAYFLMGRSSSIY